MTSLDAVGRDLDAPGSQGGALRTEMPRVSNCQATRCDVFSTGITILAQLFGHPPAVFDQLPAPFWGFFSDAALTVFVDTVYGYLGKTTFLTLGGDLTSDAVKPLKGK